jgi:hypothetical protein
MNIVKYKSWQPSGDLLVCMPGIRQIWKETNKKGVIMQRLNVLGEVYTDAVPAILDENGMAVCMNKTQWEMLKPLLLAQEYIEDCEVWDGQPFEINLDQLRENAYTPMPHGSIYHWEQLLIPQMAANLTEKWLSVPESNNLFNDLVISDHVIINKTERYQNQLVTYFFLKDYQDKLIFAGTEKEHKVFCAAWNISIPRLIVKDFLELAQAIKSCKFFIGNQSMCFHIAEGMGKKRLLEICPRVANVWPIQPDGFPFMHQVNLEYYFSKFINE